jgi:hypothetical protein
MGIFDVGKALLEVDSTCSCSIDGKSKAWCAQVVDIDY